jgi:sterol desaturase/sphingolipid hydroxylase (fatty acid hydroxylase superfamily)
MLLQIIIGIFAASFLEWFVHKHILHNLAKKKKSIFSFHWSGHHASARRNNFSDSLFSAREAVGISLLCAIFAPVIFVLPYTYMTMLTHAILYFILHNTAHKYPKFGKKYMRWHYDHHMGKNQNMNWCVVHPLADYIMKTRIKYDYEQ